jgi:hypothetical protein
MSLANVKGRAAVMVATGSLMSRWRPRRTPQ